jgi:hypothetical protein
MRLGTAAMSLLYMNILYRMKPVYDEGILSELNKEHADGMRTYLHYIFSSHEINARMVGVHSRLVLKLLSQFL